MSKLNDKSLERLSSCDEDIQTVFIAASDNSPLEFQITHGKRTVNEQKELYAQGRTKPGKIVTDCDGVKKVSKHNYTPSKAVDVVIKINGEITWDEKYYKQLGAHILSVSDSLFLAGKISKQIEWGGHWKKKDYPHYEID